MNGSKTGNHRIRLAAIACAAICVILAAAACLPFATGRLRIMKCYDDDLVMRMFSLAGTSYRNQMGQCAAVQELIEAAKSGEMERFLSLYRAQYAPDSAAGQSGREMLMDMMNTSVSLVSAMRASGQIFAGTGHSFDEKAFEMFMKRPLARSAAYEDDCQRLAELVLDEAAWAAYGEAYMAQLSEVVRADMLASTSLYQLISREMISMKQMQREGYPDASVLEIIPQENLEELLHLSEGDLKERCAERLQAFWAAECRLGMERE